MILKWKESRAWSIGTGLNDGSVVLIVPGVNDIAQKKWDMIKDHVDVKTRIKSGTLEVVSPGEDLSALSVKDAIKLIKETQNTELLRKWVGEETRENVNAAAEKQLEKIEEERQKPKDGDTDSNS